MKRRKESNGNGASEEVEVERQKEQRCHVSYLTRCALAPIQLDCFKCTQPNHTTLCENGLELSVEAEIQASILPGMIQMNSVAVWMRWAQTAKSNHCEEEAETYDAQVTKKI